MDLPTPAMHDGELPIDEALVARLLTAQLPRFAHLPVRAWRSTGAVNALFRFGDHLVARLLRFAEALKCELGALDPAGGPEADRAPLLDQNAATHGAIA